MEITTKDIAPADTTFLTTAFLTTSFEGFVNTSRSFPIQCYFSTQNVVDLRRRVDTEAIVCYSVNYHTKEAMCMRKTLIEKRREANLTQTQMAKAVGISVTMYSRIESGKRTLL